MARVNVYKPKNKIRILTAASLFDGHDAAINMIRRMLQSSGAEVIHLGHDRSVMEIVQAAIQENVQGIAITSYQGGHIEFFKYMYDLLEDKGCSHIKIFGGGGGVILPNEIKELEEYGICKIYSPDDGRKMGLQGMINDVLMKCDFLYPQKAPINIEGLNFSKPYIVSQLISCFENNLSGSIRLLPQIQMEADKNNAPVIGITGTGGAGKSSLLDELLLRFISLNPNKNIAVISVDPSKRKTGGALLGDRIRMNSASHPNVFMRSLATRQLNLSLSAYIHEIIIITKAAKYDLIILETSGIGQSDSEIVDYADLSLYVMTPEYGAPSQLEKIDMLDYADLVVLNKSDKTGSLDALRDVKKQYQRNHIRFDEDVSDMPVYSTIASHFGDHGVDVLYQKLICIIASKLNLQFKQMDEDKFLEEECFAEIIPTDREHYLSDICHSIRKYNQQIEEFSDFALKIQSIKETISCLSESDPNYKDLQKLLDSCRKKLPLEYLSKLENWDEFLSRYKDEFYVFKVRGKEFKIKTHTKTLSNLSIPKIAVPHYLSWADRLSWLMKENFPGEFPYAAGVFPFKREFEDPIRMFAGEGNPERTNLRFHYLSKGQSAIRLSTAYDSVTLYGRDPDKRPDIYGKIGNSGVSVCSLDDTKKLYSGFDLCDTKTSVSMTINGPASVLTAYFLNTAIDYECEKYIRQQGNAEATRNEIESFYADRGTSIPKFHGDPIHGEHTPGLLLLGVPADFILEKDIYEKIKIETLKKVRGTVQADILKEDQAQNTCIFSTDFSLKLMGDMQEYFIRNKVQNFYSVSISGYHIAEAGANPITQLAFTLANGFTYVEYYLSRGMQIDSFAPNLSFFFSNGLDPEYSVLGRVARLIWAKAMKNIYNANRKSQRLKYHIQTSGRSLHAQEIDFNDIRTSLQALYAIYDNCNSLHTNAYDEAITTPTEESVRRAMAIQLIINREYGLAKNQNFLQGSFVIEELTDLVEEAVLSEFDRINARGGVIGAMESMYQRGKIQEESLYYEKLKHSGEIPIVGVNTFISSKGSPVVLPGEVIRASVSEKENQINTLNNLHKTFVKESKESLLELVKSARKDLNLFNCLMETCKYCSLGQITETLFSVGGQYRRNM
ncbi:MAG: methylmalonyl-CoA mutase family protein [Bacteroidales bacterium]